MENIFAFLLALTAAEPDTAYFDTLLAKGEGAPVVATNCRDSLAPGEIEGQTIFCGTVTVPEDHDAPDNGQTVDLAFAILKSHTSYPSPDPVVYLHGGPGIGNIGGGLAAMDQFFGAFRETRDVVIFDQRAAGVSSDSVTCHQQLTRNISQILVGETAGVEADGAGKPVATDFLRDCLEEIVADGTDLSKYNTRQNAMDVPMILRAMGYDQWNLYGISYGTKLTLEVMRSAPEGTRAAVIDGVAPPWVKLYNTLALPLAESMARLVQDCAADDICAEAYPDLGRVLREVIAQMTAGETMIEGAPVPPQFLLSVIAKRNDRHNLGSLTPYLPAIIYELYNGDEIPTLEMVVEDWEFSVPQPDAATIIETRADTLTEQQTQLLDLALKDAEIIETATEALDNAIADLRKQLRRDRELGAMPGLFDAELSAAIPDTITSPEAARTVLEDYASLRLSPPSRARLTEFVAAHFDGPHLGRLLALVEAMTEAEIASIFGFAAETVRARTVGFQQDNIDISLYACQEDLPYNSLSGYENTTAAQPYDVSSLFDPAAENFYAICGAFAPAPRENWHEVVHSDIPTVSIGSGWDIQTAASWAKEATRGLSNAQHFFMAEAGHGALVYAPCVGELAVAFFNDPSRQLDSSCEEATQVPAFHVAPWVDKADAQDAEVEETPTEETE